MHGQQNIKILKTGLFKMETSGSLGSSEELLHLCQSTKFESEMT